MVNLTNSARLRFRLMDLGDAELLYELDQDPDVMRYINGGTPTSRASINEVFVPRLRAYLNPAKGWGIWQVNRIADDAYLGWILVRPFDFFSDAPKWHDIELGWRFKQSVWGQGYATEAAHAVLHGLAEQQPEIRYFSAIAMAENIGFIAVMKRLGMRFQRQYVHHDPLGNWPVVHYQLAV
ncbi:GCN5-related N-acetyltransferase [Pseudoalteromonas sp. SW0106-04]|uniref:GNAT family N-acetyltransferase n=1 Tax=Pseudoalteromonas sp. SW0106-04 TaxID=1702169 RepID=UPI0006B5C690|nr:GNAT family N-acetyltransferase [Pseudoalteromonas sp. SW0106-04]GAP74488.1 GCN5-related N-acetyltransferase [Pseudoalteromonas sp. SW0106-04]